MYFLGLSFRNIVKSLYFLKIIKISHVSIGKWIQEYKIQIKVSNGNKKIQEYVIDKIALKAGSSELIWIWVIIEPTDKQILSFHIKRTKNMFVIAERFLSDILDKYGKHQVSSDDGNTWYPPQAFKSLKLNHHLHFHYKKA